MRIALVQPRLIDSTDRLYDSLLITDALKRVLGIGTGRGNQIPPLSLLTLAAVTPPNVEVVILDERVEPIDTTQHYDLVGITAVTRAAPRAYQLAAEFHKSGATVVMGGIHASALPEEAIQHVDCVVKGEAEGIWKQVLEDFSHHSLPRFYEGPLQNDLDALPLPRRDLVDPRRYLTTKVLTATRGCPNSCTFCSAGIATHRKYRCRSISSVISELRMLSGRYAIFLDDNLAWDPEYAKSLFRALVPLGLRWGGAVSVSALEDEELVQLAAQSGCITLAIGFESISPRVLRSIAKHRTNDSDRYGALIERVHRAGIAIEGYFIVGFDEDNSNTFPELVEFINNNRIEIPCLHILIPYPGSRIYEQFSQEQRLITKDWNLYDSSGTNVVFRPKCMGAEELHRQYLSAKRSLFSYKSIAHRALATPSLVTLGVTLHHNLQWRRSSSG